MRKHGTAAMRSNPAEADRKQNSENNNNNSESRKAETNKNDTNDKAEIDDSNQASGNASGNDNNCNGNINNNGNNRSNSNQGNPNLYNNSDYSNQRRQEHQNHHHQRRLHRVRLRPPPMENFEEDQNQFRMISEMHQMRHAVQSNTLQREQSEQQLDERFQGTLRLIGAIGESVANSFKEINYKIDKNNDNNNSNNSTASIAAKANAKIIAEQLLKPTFTITGQEGELERMENRRQIETYCAEASRVLGAKYDDRLAALTLYSALAGPIKEKAKALTSAYFTSTNKFLRFYDTNCPYSSEAIRQLTEIIRRRPKLSSNNKDALLTLISDHNLLKKQHAYAMQQANDVIDDHMNITEMEHVQIVYGQLPEKWQSLVRQMNQGLVPRTWDVLAVLIKNLHDELQFSDDLMRRRREADVIARSNARYNISNNNTKTGHNTADMIDETPQQQTAFGVNALSYNPRNNYNPNYNRGRGRGRGRGGGRGGYTGASNVSSVRDTYVNTAGSQPKPFNIGARFPRYLVQSFKQRKFDQCYMKMQCHQCKRGGHSKWLCAFLHAFRQSWLNMYEVSFQKGLDKPEFNKTAGNGRGFAVNNVSDESNNDQTFKKTIEANSWASQVAKLSKGSTDAWSDNQKAAFVDKLVDNLKSDKDISKSNKKQ